jgi:hypothetical protein
MGGNVMMSYKRFRTLLWLGTGLLLLACELFILKPAHSQTYNRFTPANGILVGDVDTYVTTPAASSNVISLWSGTCSPSTFLRGDGSCAVPAGTGVTSVALTMPSGLSVAGSPITTSGTLAVTTALSGLINGTGSGFANATASNVTAEFSGTCDATTFLRGDGSCQTVGAGATGANPTATIGLTAVNGSAGTFLRSDGAPALSQGIAPTWTNSHAFSLSGNGVAPAINLSSQTPTVQWNQTTAAADNRRWMFYPNGADQFVGSVKNDANTVEAVWVSVDRTGAVVDNVLFPAQTIFGAVGNGPASAAKVQAAGNSSVALNNTSLTANNRLWDFVNAGDENLHLRAVTDDGSASEDWATVSRTAASIDTVLFPNSPVGVGSASGNGNLTIHNSAITVASEFITLNGTGAAGGYENLYVDVRRNSTSYASLRGDGTSLNFAIPGGTLQVNSQNVQRIARARMNDSSGTCSLANNYGFTSCTHNSTGAVSFNMTAAGFTSAPVCTATRVDSGGVPATAVTVSSTTAGTWTAWSSSALTNSDVMVICTGT